MLIICRSPWLPWERCLKLQEASWPGSVTVRGFVYSCLTSSNKNTLMCAHWSIHMCCSWSSWTCWTINLTFGCCFKIFLWICDFSSPSPIVGFLLSLKVLAESAHMLSLIDYLDAVCSGNSCGESSSAVDYTTWASCCPTLPQIRKASRNFLTLTLHLMIEVDDILCC